MQIGKVLNVKQLTKRNSHNSACSPRTTYCEITNTIDLLLNSLPNNAWTVVNIFYDIKWKTSQVTPLVPLAR